MFIYIYVWYTKPFPPACFGTQWTTLNKSYCDHGPRLLIIIISFSLPACWICFYHNYFYFSVYLHTNKPDKQSNEANTLKCVYCTASTRASTVAYVVVPGRNRTLYHLHSSTALPKCCSAELPGGPHTCYIHLSDILLHIWALNALMRSKYATE